MAAGSGVVFSVPEPEGVNGTGSTKLAMAVPTSVPLYQRKAPVPPMTP
jgi:hypothetical protein